MILERVRKGTKAMLFLGITLREASTMERISKLIKTATMGNKAWVDREEGLQ